MGSDCVSSWALLIFLLKTEIYLFEIQINFYIHGDTYI